MKNIYLIILLTIFNSCSKDEEAACSKAENKDECVSRGADIDERTASLNLEFFDSYYYNYNTAEWVEVKSSDLNGGLIGSSLPIFSNFLGLSSDLAVDKILNAKEQYQNPTIFSPDTFSVIPYIEAKFEGTNTEIVYEYKKRDLEGNQSPSYIGKFKVKNGRALLPFVNEMFGGNLYSNNEIVGKKYIHSLTIKAQSLQGQGARTVQLEFESTLELPLIDFYVDFSDNMDNFNLNNRFNYYYKGSDGLPNQDFSFLSLKERDEPEAVQTDIRVLFKERPVIKIKQDIFSENPLNISKFKNEGKAELIRGFEFYQKRVELDSFDDFKMKVYLNNTIQTLVGGREFIVTGLPAGTRWDLDFVIDFSPNAAYVGNGLPLITPYKPTCNTELNKPFYPLQAEQEKKDFEALEGYYSHCHYDTGDTVKFTKNQLLASGIDKKDTFFQYFNYMPMDETKNEIGHFDGIRKITFSLEGCMRVYAKTPTSSTWELKTQNNVSCADENDPDSDGWVYFNAEKTYTMTQLIDLYGSTPGLTPLIQSMGSKSFLSTPHFDFNGVRNNTNHIY